MKYPIEIKGKTKKQVTKLNLSNRNLTSFPENIFEYSNLTKLVLSNNRIKAIPAEILKLKKLRMLDLSNNEIKVLHSAVFKLQKLRVLNVYGNQIKKFPKQVFVSKIEKLIVGNNPLEVEELEKIQLLCDVVTTKNKPTTSEDTKSIVLGTNKSIVKDRDNKEKEMSKKHNIFISYSHKDSEWLDRVKTHLKPLERYYDLDEWDDQKLRTSDEWKDEISKALNNATIAVLLFSPNFMASDFIVNNELQPLLENASIGGVKIMPVMVRPCAMFDESGLSKYQATNGKEKTLIEMNEGEIDRVLMKLVEDIKKFLNKKK